MKRRFMTLVVVGTFVAATPVLAYSFSGQSLDDVVRSSYAALYRIGQEETQKVLGDDIDFDILAGVNPLTGTLDPLANRDHLLSQSEAGRILETPGQLEGREQANILDQAAARTRAEPLIGETSTVLLDDKVDHTTAALARIQSATEATLAATSTQESVKQLSLLNQQTAELLGALRLEMLESRVDSQYQSLNVVNLSETVDEERRGRLLSQELYLRSLLKNAEMFTLF